MGSRPRGRLKRTWLEVVQRDCQVHGLSKDDAMVRGRWRKMIRMVDDREGCEWMDVCLVPAHPGRPGQRAVKRSCVCVCSIESMSLSCTIFEILTLICSKFKTVTLPQPRPFVGHFVM